MTDSPSITELITRAHETARSKGFHDKPVSVAKAVGLIRSELAEAVEADRKPGAVDICLSWAEFVCLLATIQDPASAAPGFPLADELQRRGRRRSVGEELADAAIRIFDLAGLLKVDLEAMLSLQWQLKSTASLRRLQEVVTADATGDVDDWWDKKGFEKGGLAGYLEGAHRTLGDVSYNVTSPRAMCSGLASILAVIAVLCHWLGIDLQEAVLEKMAKNEGRPHMHGGKRY